MNKITSDLEFEILGQKVHYKADAEKKEYSVQEIIDKINQEILKLEKDLNGVLEQNQLAVLVALRLAERVVDLEHKYKLEINAIQAKAAEVLHQVEDGLENQATS